MRFSDNLPCYARSLALLGLVLGTASLCSADTITYHVNPTTIGSGSVTGNIVTDGTIGLLSNSNIVGWDLVLNDGTDPPVTLNGSNSIENTEPDQDLSATATQLLFNFSGPGGLFYFSNLGLGSAVCWSTAGITCTSAIPGPSGASLVVNNMVGNRQFTNRSGTQVIAAVPEPSTLALLGTGIALLGFRKLENKQQQVGNRGSSSFWGFVLGACEPILNQTFDTRQPRDWRGFREWDRTYPF